MNPASRFRYVKCGLFGKNPSSTRPTLSQHARRSRLSRELLYSTSTPLICCWQIHTLSKEKLEQFAFQNHILLRACVSRTLYIQAMNKSLKIWRNGVLCVVTFFFDASNFFTNTHRFKHTPNRILAMPLFGDINFVHCISPLELRFFLPLAPQRFNMIFGRCFVRNIINRVRSQQSHNCYFAPRAAVCKRKFLCFPFSLRAAASKYIHSSLQYWFSPCFRFGFPWRRGEDERTSDCLRETRIVFFCVRLEARMVFRFLNNFLSEQSDVSITLQGAFISFSPFFWKPPFLSNDLNLIFAPL